MLTRGNKFIKNRYIPSELLQNLIYIFLTYIIYSKPFIDCGFVHPVQCNTFIFRGQKFTILKPCISVPEKQYFFILANWVDPDEMPPFGASHLGLHCSPALL